MENKEHLTRVALLTHHLAGAMIPESPSYFNRINPPVETEELVEIGDEAVWILSSAKAGNGIEQLRDGDKNTFWQSDGIIPHYINIQFMKKTRISQLCLYLDYKSDESYTPSKLAIRGGMHMQDLKDIKTVDLKEPQDWFVFPLTSKLANGTEK